MAIRVTVPTELEELIIAWAEEAGVDPAAMALKVLSQGASRRRNLSTYAQKQAKAKKEGAPKRSPGRPRKAATTKAPAKAPAKATTTGTKKRGRPPGSKNKPKAAPPAKAPAKALRAIKRPPSQDQEHSSDAA